MLLTSEVTPYFFQVKFCLSFCHRRNFSFYWCASRWSGSRKSVVVLEKPQEWLSSFDTR